MPQNLSDRDNFYAYQLCQPRPRPGDFAARWSQSQETKLFKVARVTLEETVTGRRTVLSIASSVILDKEAEQNELPRPKAVVKSYAEASLDRIRVLGLSKV